MPEEGTQQRGDEHEVCDYEGSPYRRVFWEEADRAYEDAAERLAVRALLPRRGGRIVDLGAGFGRLATEYRGYERVILLDYAYSMLADARCRMGDACTYVCADLYHLPFASASLDTVVQVRVLHHVANIEDAFAEVARCLRPGGTFLLEYANKRHVKAILRHALGRQRQDPFDTAPHQFVPLNWDFHPAYVEHALAAAGLEVRGRRAVSLFRLPLVKRLVPPSTLARLDALLGGSLGRMAPGPSQFVRSHRPGAGAPAADLWRCPACGFEPLPAGGDTFDCPACRRRWPLVDGIHVFRAGAVPDAVLDGSSA